MKTRAGLKTHTVFSTRQLGWDPHLAKLVVRLPLYEKRAGWLSSRTSSLDPVNVSSEGLSCSPWANEQLPWTEYFRVGRRISLGDLKQNLHNLEELGN